MAAGYDVGVAKGQRMATVSVGAGSNYFNYLGSSPGDSAGTAQNSGLGVTGGVTLAIPLFQGGRPAAQVRQAQAQHSEAIEHAIDIERTVIANTRPSYAIWRSEERRVGKECVSTGRSRGWPDH